MPINIEKLQNHLSNKIVAVQKHPTHNLFIYNYTDKAQYDKIWDEVTTKTRGLILDENYNIHATSFSKLFIEYVLDDRTQVVDLWRSLGLTCLQVAYGDF